MFLRLYEQLASDRSYYNVTVSLYDAITSEAVHITIPSMFLKYIYFPPIYYAKTATIKIQMIQQGSNWKRKLD